MIIRKIFYFNNAHIVRNCSSDRCKYSLHAHTYKVEVLFEGYKLDNGGMIYDFGLMKSSIKNVIKSFDKTITIWDRDKKLLKLLNNFERYIILPFSPSAEQYAILFYYLIENILKATKFKNGEGNICLYSVKVHETVTGYAETTRCDVGNIDIDKIYFSKTIDKKWFKKLKRAIKSKKYFKNPKVKRQI